MPSVATLSILVGLAVLVAALGAWAGFRAGRRAGDDEWAYVAEELAHYQAFTRLLRDQGERIARSTGEAAVTIVGGLREVDHRLDRLNADLLALGTPEAQALAAQAQAAAQPAIQVLGSLQFQDLVQQQITFLSQLSLVLDRHMSELARSCRTGAVGHSFADAFQAALAETVMTSQRNDHHAAVGLNETEQDGPRVELF